jgi:site-specific recombinase XerD
MTEDLQLKGYARSTSRVYLHAVAQLARHYDKSPADITEEELRGYFLHLTQTQNCSRGALKVAQSGIKFCFAVTLQRQWPVLGLLRAGKQSPLPVILSRPEVRAILGSVRAPVYRVCLDTIYCCGLRISEGVALQVADVDSQRMVLRVRGKGNKDRQVPLAQRTLEELRALWKLHRSQPWLFPGRLQPHAAVGEGPVNRDNLRTAFHAALQQSGVTKTATVHSLRHAYATHLLEAGVQLRLIQEILGHKSPRTTAIYTHLTAEVRAQVSQPLQALVGQLYR